jgi:GT2 family glycosyltransferase
MNSIAWNIAVAIPVKNEAERIASCLRSLSEQYASNGDALPPFDVVLFVNNSDDETAAIAAALAPTLNFRLTVVNATLPPPDASAGGARRHAMEVAARLLEAQGGQGLLLTTDADSRVPPNWIAATIAAIDAGADAVAGTLALDSDDEAALPASLKARGALEARYEALVCELEARLDPQPHDPWPRHPTESGASFALTLASFRAVGGVPRQALGEDRALAAALRLGGFRIRHAPEVKIITSGRLFGRAEGGCADTMRLRIEEPTARCDPYLRPALDIVRQNRGLYADAQTRALGPEDLPTQILLARGLILSLRASHAIRELIARLRSRISLLETRAVSYQSGDATWLESDTTTMPSDAKADQAAPS